VAGASENELNSDFKLAISLRSASICSRAGFSVSTIELTNSSENSADASSTTTSSAGASSAGASSAAFSSIDTITPPSVVTIKPSVVSWAPSGAGTSPSSVTTKIDFPGSNSPSTLTIVPSTRVAKLCVIAVLYINVSLLTFY